MPSTIADRPPPYELVAFDCDSTLSSIEGIEELATGEHKAGILRLTQRAMDGELRLEEVYGQRLELVRPSRADLDWVGGRYVETALPHARELVAALRSSRKRVCVVSGGLLPAVQRLARHLGIPPSDVFAVDVSFDAGGAYAGFDARSPLARAGGKIEVLRRLSAPLAGATALVGDGATDLEAAAEVGRFVAFGGVERRAAVFDAAAVGSDAADMAALVPLLFAPAEIEELRRWPEHRGLVDAADGAL